MKNNELYYLREMVTDRDPHGIGHDCGVCHPSTGTALGVSIYALTPEGLQLYRNWIMESDSDAFGEWLQEQEAQSTIYGPSEEVAVANAILAAKQDELLLVNYPSRIAQPLNDVLFMLVGEEGALTDLDYCQCHDGLLKNKTMCQTCYARLVYEILSYHLLLKVEEGR